MRRPSRPPEGALHDALPSGLSMRTRRVGRVPRVMRFARAHPPPRTRMSRETGRRWRGHRPSRSGTRQPPYRALGRAPQTANPALRTQVVVVLEAANAEQARVVAVLTPAG